METRIIGINIRQRSNEASQLQNILTKYGCNIKTRLGLHEVTDNVCSTTGIILLEVIGQTADMDNLEKELKEIAGYEIQRMIFNQ